MLIQACGLFWQARDVVWKPGAGRKAHLYGRWGNRNPGLELADVWHQRGVYVLHGDHGAYYAGLAIDTPLGKRLQQHTEDEHAGQWDKFSWFGYCEMSPTPDYERLYLPEPLKEGGQTSLRSVIKNAEAMLILVLHTANRVKMQFQEGWQWEQVGPEQWPLYAKRIGCA